MEGGGREGRTGRHGDGCCLDYGYMVEEMQSGIQGEKEGEIFIFWGDMMGL